MDSTYVLTTITQRLIRHYPHIVNGVQPSNELLSRISRHPRWSGGFSEFRRAFNPDRLYGQLLLALNEHSYEDNLHEYGKWTYLYENVIVEEYLLRKTQREVFDTLVEVLRTGYRNLFANAEEVVAQFSTTSDGLW